MSPHSKLLLEPEPGSGMLFRWRSPPPTSERRMMYHSLRVLSAAQILALDTTPVLIAPAPGPGLVNVPYRVLFELLAGSSSFLGGGPLQIVLGPVANGITATAAYVPFLLEAADTVTGTFIDLFALSAFASALVLNLPLYLYNSGAPFTAGNGSLTVSLSYEALRLQ